MAVKKPGYADLRYMCCTLLHLCAQACLWQTLPHTECKLRLELGCTGLLHTHCTSTPQFAPVYPYKNRQYTVCTKILQSVVGSALLDIVRRQSLVPH